MQYHLRSVLCCCLLLLALCGWGAPLQDGDRVVFVGDSAIGQHGCTALVMDAVALHHPGATIAFRTVAAKNLGFVTTGLPGFFPPLLDADVLSAKPTVAIISFGQESVNKKPMDARYIQTWITKPLGAMVQKLQAAKVTVLLATPAPFDLEAQPEMKGAPAESLAAITQAIRDIATQNHVTLIDVNDVWQQVRKGEPLGVLSGTNVALTPTGQALLAGLFLHALDETNAVSTVTIDAAAGAAQAKGCAVTDLHAAAESITFTRTDAALPAYLPDYHLPAEPPVKLPDAMLDLAGGEQYTLQITGLKAGRWKVIAGSTTVGTYTNDELATGVNLTHKPGPWQTLGERLHQQAVAQENLYTERCNTLTHISTPPDAEPQRLALLQRVDAYIDAMEKQRQQLPANHAWAWKIEHEP